MRTRISGAKFSVRAACVVLMAQVLMVGASRNGHGAECFPPEFWMESPDALLLDGCVVNSENYDVPDGGACSIEFGNSCSPAALECHKKHLRQRITEIDERIGQLTVYQLKKEDEIGQIDEGIAMASEAMAYLISKTDPTTAMVTLASLSATVAGAGPGLRFVRSSWKFVCGLKGGCKLAARQEIKKLAVKTGKEALKTAAWTGIGAGITYFCKEPDENILVTMFLDDYQSIQKCMSATSVQEKVQGVIDSLLARRKIKFEQTLRVKKILIPGLKKEKAELIKQLKQTCPPPTGDQS